MELKKNKKVFHVIKIKRCNCKKQNVTSITYHKRLNTNWYAIRQFYCDFLIKYQKLHEQQKNYQKKFSLYTCLFERYT